MKSSTLIVYRDVRFDESFTPPTQVGFNDLDQQPKNFVGRGGEQKNEVEGKIDFSFNDQPQNEEKPAHEEEF